ncbi:MAG: hypothetical protein AB1389_10650 [Campylobacterota bacterium]
MKNEHIVDYITKQLDNLLPDGYIIESFDIFISKTLNNLMFEKVKIWKENPELDVLNSTKYPIFLYKLSRELYLNNEIKGATKIFYLNKILHSIDLFYEIDLKENFLLGHTINSVFCKAKYGNYSVFWQNILVGVDKNKRPQLNDGLVMFPNSSIVGDCHVGKNVVISANTNIINTNIPDNVIVFANNDKLVFKELNEYYAKKYFEINED